MTEPTEEPVVEEQGDAPVPEPLHPESDSEPGSLDNPLMLQPDPAVKPPEDPLPPAAEGTRYLRVTDPWTSQLRVGKVLVQQTWTAVPADQADEVLQAAQAVEVEVEEGTGS